MRRRRRWRSGASSGAFTGAVTDEEGLFATAENGTLFLDEIGELDLELQGYLLRVLQEGVYTKLGSVETHKVVNVRHRGRPLVP